MEDVVSHFGLKSVEDLLASVGYGKITPLQVVRKIQPRTEETPETEEEEAILHKVVDRGRTKKPRTDGVTVKGLNDILIRFGRCCQPVPGDPITGFITRGQGVTVHRKTCVNALKMNPERRIDVEWNQDSSEMFPAKIYIRSHDRMGLLADLAANISKNGANILSVNSEIRGNKTVDSVFTLSVKDTGQLEKLLSDLKQVKMILEVKRINL
jgi:GTP pyrophosphokinase